MTKSTAHRYSIEIKDAALGISIVSASVDWTDDQKRLPILVISRVSGQYNLICSNVSTSLSNTQYH
jgi:hypothetical protein